jgi:hypothetical protein
LEVRPCGTRLRDRQRQREADALATPQRSAQQARLGPRMQNMHFFVKKIGFPDIHYPEQNLLNLYHR